MPRPKRYEVNTLNDQQRIAFEMFKKNDILFLLGPAGCGKTHLATSFALDQIFNVRHKSRIILTRPVVEAGESLGYLPGTFQDKISPYILPVYDVIKKLVSDNAESFEKFCEKYVELAPLAYLRGRTFDNAICILDEAQNCTTMQLKLFLTRLGKNSKMIVTGDPTQSDLFERDIPLTQIVNALRDVEGLDAMYFDSSSIVRHPLVERIVNKLAKL